MKVISLYFTIVGLLLLDTNNFLLLLETILTNLEEVSHNQEQIMIQFFSIEALVMKTIVSFTVLMKLRYRSNLYLKLSIFTLNLRSNLKR